MINASYVIAPVAAVQPKSGGIAPGIAPTNTAIGPTLFSGVYAKTYNTMLSTPKNVVSGLVKIQRNPIPKKANSVVNK